MAEPPAGIGYSVQQDPNPSGHFTPPAPGPPRHLPGASNWSPRPEMHAMKLRSTDIFRLPWNTLIEDATGAGRPCRMIFTRDGLKTYPSELPRELRRIIFRRMLGAVAAPLLIATGLYIAAVVTILYSGDFSGPNELVMPVPLSVVVAVFLTIGSTPTRMAYR